MNHINYPILQKYLEKYPGGTFSEFKEETGYTKLTDVTYYQFRKKFQNGETKEWARTAPQGVKPNNAETVKEKRSGRKSYYSGNYEKILDYMKDNPDAKFQECTKNTGINISSSTFSRMRANPEKYRGIPGATEDKSIGKYVRRKNALYQTIFTAADEYKKPLDMLRDFISALNERGARLEIVQRVDPDMVEVREVTR